MLTEYLCCSLCTWNDKTMISKAQLWRWHRGSRGSDPLILTLALDGGELFTSHPGCFTPRNEPRYSWRKRLCRPQYWSGRFVPTENRTTDRPAHSHYIDWATFNMILIIFMLNSTAARRKFWVLQEVGISSTSLSTVSGRINKIAGGLCQYLQGTTNRVYSPGGRYMQRDTTTEPRPTVLC